jgi:TPR repeat protein
MRLAHLLQKRHNTEPDFDYTPAPMNSSFSDRLFQLSATLVLAVTALDGTARAETLDLNAVRASADKGDANAEFKLGRAYYHGEGVPKDLTKAFGLYQKSAQQGNMKAENNLASMYRDGEGTPRDVAQATQWYQKAAEQGGALAQYNLAVILIHQRKSRDPKEAAQWFEKAANQGVPQAQLELGRLYFTGDTGFAANSALAAKWLEQPAAAGNADAQEMLAELYQNGNGVPQDIKKAFNLYQGAANQGNATAQGCLGLMYCTGSGAKLDPVTGYKWLLLGASQGDLNARHFASEFMNTITKAQYHQAQDMADNFKPVVTAPTHAGP